jgi:hypothetical protein
MSLRSFIAADNDWYVITKLWAIAPPHSRIVAPLFEDTELDEKGATETSSGKISSSSWANSYTNRLDTMAYALSKFVTIPSVSSNSSNREDCRQAAIWLKKCLTQLGAQSTLVWTSLLLPSPLIHSSSCSFLQARGKIHLC